MNDEKTTFDEPCNHETGGGSHCLSCGALITRAQTTEKLADVIAGFPAAEPVCRGCGAELLMANAWMTDGCPCNSPLGVNSMNETRWRLLMQLQQKQSRRLDSLEAALRKIEELTWGGKGESAVHILASLALNSDES